MLAVSPPVSLRTGLTPPIRRSRRKRAMQQQPTSPPDVKDQIVAFKRQLAPRRSELKRAFAEVRDHVARASERICADDARGVPTIPELAYADIAAAKVSDSAGAAIRGSGVAIVRGVFPAAQATEWFDEIGRYLDENAYEE